MKPGEVATGVLESRGRWERGRVVIGAVSPTLAPPTTLGGGEGGSGGGGGGGTRCVGSAVALPPRSLLTQCDDFTP